VSDSVGESLCRHPKNAAFTGNKLWRLGVRFNPMQQLANCLPFIRRHSSDEGQGVGLAEGGGSDRRASVRVGRKDYGPTHPAKYAPDGHTVVRQRGERNLRGHDMEAEPIQLRDYLAPTRPIRPSRVHEDNGRVLVPLVAHFAVLLA
jgi:hypothetical protein